MCSTCKRCGNCCSNYLPLSIKEIKDLKRIVKKYKLKPTERLFEVNYHISCPFLDVNTNDCLIYEERPLICRMYNCEKFNKQKFDDFTNNLIKEKRYLTDLRKEIFN